MYAVTLDGVNKSYANTLEEAEEVVNKLKSENKSKNELNLAISQVYTTNLDELNSVQVAETKNNVSNNAKKLYQVILIHLKVYVLVQNRFLEQLHPDLEIRKVLEQVHIRE